MSNPDKLLSSTKPYLLRAFYDWITDNNCTPYILVNAEYPGVAVPKKYVENGRIVLNIDVHAISNLHISKDSVNFDARFAGVLHVIYIPIDAIGAIYAHENGRGMVFAEETLPVTSEQSNEVSHNKTIPIKNGKPTLKIVK